MARDKGPFKPLLPSSHCSTAVHMTMLHTTGHLVHREEDLLDPPHPPATVQQSLSLNESSSVGLSQRLWMWGDADRQHWSIPDHHLPRSVYEPQCSPCQAFSHIHLHVSASDPLAPTAHGLEAQPSCTRAWCPCPLGPTPSPQHPTQDTRGTCPRAQLILPLPKFTPPPTPPLLP